MIKRYAYQIPLNPPLEKGDLRLQVHGTPLFKGGQGGFVLFPVWPETRSICHSEPLEQITYGQHQNYLYERNLV